MHAFVFPGQGAQFVGMGKDLYDNVPLAKELFDRANEILGFPITDIMFAGTDEQLKQTKVTQPAIFLHSVILARSLGDAFKPDMAAGHSLGEFSALVAAGAARLRGRAEARVEARYGDAESLRAESLDDGRRSSRCRTKRSRRSAASVDGVVVPANYNCPGQLVISGTNEAIDEACAKLTAAGAKRALKLNVGGAFHSPLMEPARVELEAAIAAAPFAKPVCPVYQNVDAKPHTDPAEIRANLIAQLTSPVRWTQIVQNMLADGATSFTELGPGSVLQGLIKKVDRSAVCESKQSL